MYYENLTQIFSVEILPYRFVTTPSHTIVFNSAFNICFNESCLPSKIYWRLRLCISSLITLSFTDDTEYFLQKPPLSRQSYRTVCKQCLDASKGIPGKPQRCLMWPSASAMGLAKCSRSRGNSVTVIVVSTSTCIWLPKRLC